MNTQETAETMDQMRSLIESQKVALKRLTEQRDELLATLNFPLLASIVPPTENIPVATAVTKLSDWNAFWGNVNYVRRRILT